MIEAAVIVLVSGFSLAIGYLWGAQESREAVLKAVEDLPAAAGDQLMGELLSNPDTSFNTKKAIQGFLAAGNQAPLTNGFKVVNKKIVKE